MGLPAACLFGDLMLGTQPQPTENASRSVTILGATGSIGSSTVDLLKRQNGRFTVNALTAHKNGAALGRLGGHQNRKCDGHPGWLVLWRGWMKLQAMLDGYLAARRRICGKT